MVKLWLNYDLTMVQLWFPGIAPKYGWTMFQLCFNYG